MKRFTLLVVIFLFTATFSFAQFSARHYKVSGVNGIRAGWAFQIEVEEGDSKDITIIAPTETLEYITVKNDNGILSLDLDFNRVPTKSNNPSGVASIGGTEVMTKNRKSLNGPIKVKMQLSRISALILSGNASITTKGTFKGDRVTCLMSGNAKINSTTLAIEMLSIKASGNSSAKLTGNYKDINIELGGNSMIELSGDAHKGNISECGSSQLLLNGKANSMDIELLSNSKAELKGSTQHLKLSCEGNSILDCNNYSARSANITLTGASKVDLNVISSLEATASGASRLDYKFKGDTTNLKIQKLDGAIVRRQ